MKGGPQNAPGWLSTSTDEPELFYAPPRLEVDDELSQQMEVSLARIEDALNAQLSQFVEEARRAR